MNVAVVIPALTIDDPWRARALEFVLGWWRTNYPAWPVHIGEIPDGAPWSKGAAVGAGCALAIDAGADVLVLADADSFTIPAETFSEAVAAITDDGKSWVVPHGMVYRLREDETVRVLDGERPRLGRLCRPVYEGPAGGGFTVLTVEAWREVDGIDPRFLGWGGEDIAFGFALEALVHPAHRIGGKLVHLWHPHPAPTLRGSPESEALIAKYTEARGYPRRIRAVIEGGDPVPADPLPDPIRFRITGNRRALRLSGRNFIRFNRERIYETADPDEVDALRRHPAVAEERPRVTVRNRRRALDVSDR